MELHTCLMERLSRERGQGEARDQRAKEAGVAKQISPSPPSFTPQLAFTPQLVVQSLAIMLMRCEYYPLNPSHYTHSHSHSPPPSTPSSAPGRGRTTSLSPRANGDLSKGTWGLVSGGRREGFGGARRRGMGRRGGRTGVKRRGGRRWSWEGVGGRRGGGEGAGRGGGLRAGRGGRKVGKDDGREKEDGRE